MKLLSTCLIGWLAMGSTATILFATDTPAREGGEADKSSKPHAAQNPELAAKIIGMEIRDSADRKLAKVKDLGLDLQNGRIAEVVVATGGWLGFDEKDFLLPPGRFTYDHSSRTLRLKLERDELKAAPALDYSAWSKGERGREVRGLYQHYDMAPYFTTDDPSPENASPPSSKEMPDIILPRLGHIECAKKFLGKPVRNFEDEHLGKVEDLVIDLPAGRIVEVIIANGGLIGIGEDLTAVPPQAIHDESGRGRLRLDATREGLSRASRFKSDDLAEAASARRVAAMYREYGIPAYFKLPDDSANAAANPRDPNTDALTPTEQNGDEKDRAITARIRKEILTRRGLSASARNLRINTVNGHVTLRGPVSDEQEASIVIDIVKRVVAQNTPITDQIDVRSVPTSD